MQASKTNGFLLLGAMLTLTIPLPALTAAYEEVEVSDGGRVRGKLSFEGALPEGAVEDIAITKNPEVCDPKNTGFRKVVWVDVEDNALRGAFVFIDKIEQGKKWADPRDGNYLIEQKGCSFRPWAQVIKPGPIVIRHSDGEGVLHNINTREMIGVEKGRIVRRTIFNFGQPEPGDIEKNLKPRRSPYISLICEAHSFMFGFVMAPSHPYAVVVGEDGSYAIDDIPPGDYTLKSWHPTLGVREAELTIAASATVEANFVFSAE